MRDRLPVISPRGFHRLALASLVMTLLIVATGAAVRLTGSGLGCPDWPTCYKTQITAQLSFHPMIEFGNRLVTVVLVVLVGLTFLAALQRRPARRDLTWLSAGLIGGILAQAVVGGIVVYTKLNPYVVMVHFLASMALVVDAVALVIRSARPQGVRPGRLVIPQPLYRLTQAAMVLGVAVLAAGTATTGAGPHAGGASGQLVAKRIPIALRDMAQLHADLVLLLVGITGALAVALHTVECPERVRRAARILIAAMVAQGVVGYTQYFTHLPAGLVEVHVIGATSLVALATWFAMGLHAQVRREAADPSRGGPPGPGPSRAPSPGTPENPTRRSGAPAAVAGVLRSSSPSQALAPAGTPPRSMP